eukprot:m51a1_g1662 putative protein tyrosine phosphatase (180) ;mRNA; f:374575-375984
MGADLEKPLPAPQLYNALVSDTVFIVDLREAAEYARGHVENAVSVPLVSKYDSRVMCGRRMVVWGKASRKDLPSEIVDGFLFLGGWGARAWVPLVGITHVVNCCGDFPEETQDAAARVSGLYLPVDDEPRYAIEKHFAEFFEFVDNARAAKGKVLVHCAAGASRAGGPEREEDIRTVLR